jgi:hypothetical protein
VSWVSARKKQRQFIHERNRIISDGAEEVFKRLWAEIKKWVDEAERSGENIKTNGSPHERVVTLSGEPFSGVPIFPGAFVERSSGQRLSVKFNPEKPSVTASTQGNNVEFKIDLDKDNVACLKFDGEIVEYLDAAILILDPFLFPDLQSRKSEVQIPDEALSMEEQEAMRRILHDDNER